MEPLSNTCKECGDEFSVRKFGGRKIFCSSYCGHKQWNRERRKDPAYREHIRKLDRRTSVKRGDGRFQFVKTLAMLIGCVDCGTRDWRVIEWDHVRGKKITTINKLMGCSMKKLITELRKCDPRCGNCHMIVTQQRANLRGSRAYREVA